MAKLFSFAAIAVLLVSSAFAHEGHSESSGATPTKECAANVTAAAIAAIDNSTHLNTCAPGSTWKLTSLFEAANLSATDFAMFCNATACMDGMHALLDTLPTDCLSKYNGSEVVLSDKVDAVHDKCHMDMNDDDDDETTASSKGSSNSTSTKPAATVPTPAPTKSSASVTALSSKSLAVLISVSATTIALAL